MAKKQGTRTEIVEELNRLMAEEIEAGLRYFQIRYRLKGVDRLAAETFFEKAMEETMDHAEQIAGKIRALGHIPKLSVNLTVGGGAVGLEEALAEILEIEQQALDAYKDILPSVTGDPVLEDFIRKQVSVETEHVQEISMLLG
jgi:bacterioferritin (cytochrome b1)